MEAVVLAGGMGTRLKKLHLDVPKPMAPINGKPFLEYLLAYLINNGIKHVVLSVGYKWMCIYEYFGESYFDLKLSYSVEVEPLGTGGAIKEAVKNINNNKFYVLNGDTLFNIKLKELNLKNNSKLMLALKKENNLERYGSVDIDNQGIIKGFAEKNKTQNGSINGGIYLMKKNIFEGFDLPLEFSFEKFLENNFSNLAARARIFNEYFIDIGIPKDYKLAQSELNDISIE